MQFHKISKFAVTKPWQHQGNAYVILFHTMTKALYLLCENQWPPADDPQATNTPPQMLKTLCDSGILVERSTDENVLYHHWKDRHVYNPTHLRFKTLVTRRCNNRCTYCVLDEEPKEMTRETAQAADRFIFAQIERIAPAKVQDNFSGGEPLLNPDIIRQSVRQRHAFCRNRNIEYSFGFITNGTRLRPEWVQSLAPYGLKEIQVSIAGPEKIHNKLRPCLDHANPYGRIVDNLEAVAPLAALQIECQYDADSNDYLEIPKMLDELKAREIHITDIAFTHILKTRRNPHLGSRAGDPEIHIFLLDQAAERGLPVYDQVPSNHCMADFESVYIIDTDGSILPCASVQAGEMAYGDVHRGIDFIAESQLIKRRLPSRCLNECELLPICGGGCRLQALVHQGDFSAVDCRYSAQRELVEHWMERKAMLELEGAASHIDA